jgi:hypothetical protein
MRSLAVVLSCSPFPTWEEFGTAVYSEDLVVALGRWREAYGDSIRVVHRFPVIAGGLQDESFIRALLEVEIWLKETDKRTQHTLPATSEHFINTFLKKCQPHS